MLVAMLIFFSLLGLLYLYVNHRYSSYPFITKRQEEWVVRRDGGKCCFIHHESRGNIFICTSEGRFVYKVVALSFLDRILLGNIIVPHQLVTLCEHHYILMMKFYQVRYEKDLSYVGFAHTERYQSDNPEDEFPF